MPTANTAQVRRHNLNLIRKELMRLKKATKHQLAAATGLSQMTVGTVIKYLLKEGEVQPGDILPSGGGRPSVEYVYNGNFRKAAILYSYQQKGGTYTKMLVCDLFGNVLVSAGRTFPVVLPNSFDRMLAPAFESVKDIGSIAFGLPGQAVDGEIVTNDHPALVDSSLLSRHEKLYKVPVSFFNDMSAAAWGCHLRRGQKEKSIAALYFPQRFNPGLGLIIDGKLYEGKFGFVGERLETLPIGVDWLHLNYNDPQQVGEAIGKLVATVSAVTAPESFVLYGEFLTQEISGIIRQHAESHLLGKYGLEMEVCTEIEEDYRAGMVSLGLSALKKAVFGEDWEE